LFGHSIGRVLNFSAVHELGCLVRGSANRLLSAVLIAGRALESDARRILAHDCALQRRPRRGSYGGGLDRRNDFLNDASQDERFSDAGWDMELFSYV